MASAVARAIIGDLGACLHTVVSFSINRIQLKCLRYGLCLKQCSIFLFCVLKVYTVISCMVLSNLCCKCRSN
jgi:hypothetical protein